MHCFEVSGRVQVGIRITRLSGPPHIAIGKAPLYLAPRLAEAIKSAPVGTDLRLGDAVPVTDKGRVMLGSPPRGSKDPRALVRVTTPKLDGYVRLKANCYQEELQGDKVRRVYGAFPPVGVQIFDGSSFEQTGKGVALDILLVLNDGAAFRIERTGDQGASPEVFVHWVCPRLHLWVPRRYRAEHDTYERPARARAHAGRAPANHELGAG